MGHPEIDHDLAIASYFSIHGEDWGNRLCGILWDFAWKKSGRSPDPGCRSPDPQIASWIRHGFNDHDEKEAIKIGGTDYIFLAYIM